MRYIKTFEFFHFGSKKFDPKSKVLELISELRKHAINFVKSSNLKAFVSFSSSSVKSMEDQDVWIHKASISIYIHPIYNEKKIKVGSIHDSEYIEIDLNENMADIIKQIVEFVAGSKGRFYKKYY